MTTVLRDKIKIRGKKRLINSFKYAYQGLKYSFKYEQNILVHLVAMVLAVSFGIIFKISPSEWLVIVLIISLVIGTELINTSIEATIDLVTDQINPLAKIAKDTAAAAVLVFGLAALVIAFIIFIPKIMVIFI